MTSIVGWGDTRFGKLVGETVDMHQCFRRPKGEGSSDRRDRCFDARTLRDATLRRGVHEHAARNSRIGRSFLHEWNGCGQLCKRARAHSMTMSGERFRESIHTSDDDEGSANSRVQGTRGAVRAGFRSRAAGKRACGRSSPSLR